ncbi:hypothetical protein OIV83_002824 [Microbotryomycetes sp. JL201]|nr:hypothetical protein OIV83_002824 [Microbotryomycetes sp. JL201]
MSFPEIKKQSGNIILGAFVTAKPGKAEECKKLLLDIRDLAVSDKEPNTLTYRVTQSEENDHVFLIFEEYVLPDGVKRHAEAEPFQALMRSGVVEKAEIKFYVEQ